MQFGRTHRFVVFAVIERFIFFVIFNHKGYSFLSLRCESNPANSLPKPMGGGKERVGSLAEKQNAAACLDSMVRNAGA